jgi:hypothetical protein
MSDILSGGRIDESTSGPIPSKEDDRKRDILAEQKEVQQQNAIGGTAEPPKVSPPQQIAEPPQVAPPLPVIPSFDFSIAGSALEETREIARQTVFDVIKNVNINGQGPSIEGSTISFNIPQQPPASEVFLFQGVAIPQSQIPQFIQTPSIPQPQTPQQEPFQEIQSVVVAPPSRTSQIEEPPIVEEQKSTVIVSPTAEVQPAQSEELSFKEPPPPTISATQQEPPQINLTESVATPPPAETTIVAQLPSEPLSISEVLEGPAVIPQATISTVDDGLRPAPPQQTEDVTTQERPQPTSRLDAADFGAAQRDTPQRESRLNAEDFGTAQRDTPPRESRLDAEDFGTGGNENFLKPATGRLTEQESLKKEDEDSVRTSRAEQHPFFDRESDVRQHGETPREFKERQEQLKEERAEKIEREALEKEKQEFAKRARDGDISESPTGMIPVAFTRADGQKRILAYMSTEFVGTVEGETGTERVTSLPSDDSYYEAGGGGKAPPHPWQITIEDKSTGPTPNFQYKIEPASRLFNGFGGNSITVNGADGVFRNIETGYYILEISFSENGTVEQAQIEISANFGNGVETSGSPAKQTKARVRIGFVFLEGENYIVRQNAFHNFSLVDACRNGVPIKFPIAT